MKKFFSCLFVKFVLYTSRFLGEGTGFLFVIFGIIAAGGGTKCCPLGAVQDFM